MAAAGGAPLGSTPVRACILLWGALEVCTERAAKKDRSTVLGHKRRHVKNKNGYADFHGSMVAKAFKQVDSYSF